MLLRSVKQHYEILEKGPGLNSKLPSISVFSVNTSEGVRDPAADYYARIRIQLRDQLRKLATIGDFTDLETDPSKINLDELERLVNERIAATGP